MAQTAIAIVIIALAAAAAAVKLYRFFKPKPGRNHCSPDACASCPHRSIEDRPE